MTEPTSPPAGAAPPAARSFAAMRHGGFRAQFVTYVLSMMADNIEHVISYWVVFQKFHSPALGGFAVLSHWLPFLLFSVAGALAERFDPRRVIQVGMGLFITASLAWGYFFITDTLQMWQAMVILVIHGCAGVLWQTPNQMLIYDIVGPADLASAAERGGALSRYPDRPRRRRRDPARARTGARHHPEHHLLSAAGALAGEGALRSGASAPAPRRRAGRCGDWPILCKPSATSGPTPSSSR
jgi:hypothetical protein